jgi:hypothetical protein
MKRDALTTERILTLLNQLITATSGGSLRWTRQVGSAHRYANWNGNLLILGPDQPVSESRLPRYLFITPLDSPACIEISSDDEELGQKLLQLVALAEASSANEPPIDPFALDEETLRRLVG